MVRDVAARVAPGRSQTAKFEERARLEGEAAFVQAQQATFDARCLEHEVCGVAAQRTHGVSADAAQRQPCRAHHERTVPPPDAEKEALTNRYLMRRVGLDCELRPGNEPDGGGD